MSPDTEHGDGRGRTQGVATRPMFTVSWFQQLPWTVSTSLARQAVKLATGRSACCAGGDVAFLSLPRGQHRSLQRPPIREADLPRKRTHGVHCIQMVGRILARSVRRTGTRFPAPPPARSASGTAPSPRQPPAHRPAACTSCRRQPCSA